jgi:hypothetical protein
MEKDSVVADNEVKNIMEAPHYVNAFQCGQHAGQMASDIKNRKKEGWEIIGTKVTVSYYLKKVGNAKE